MKVHNEKLWGKILQSGKDSIQLEKYLPYKTGPLGVTCIVAEHTLSKNNAVSEMSAVEVLVELVFNIAEKRLGFPSENKSAIMCSMNMGKVRHILYFVKYEDRLIICTKVNTNWKFGPIPIPPEK